MKSTVRPSLFLTGVAELKIVPEAKHKHDSSCSSDSFRAMIENQSESDGPKYEEDFPVLLNPQFYIFRRPKTIKYEIVPTKK